MIWVAVISGLACAGAIMWHMLDARFTETRVSMARFLPALPETSARRYRFRLTRLVTSGRFWLRMVILALLMLALLPDFLTIGAARSERVGLNIVLDMSDSMRSTDASGQSRFELAEAAIATILEAGEAVAGARPFCASVTGVARQALSVPDVTNATPRPENVLPAALRLAGQRAATPGCAATHAVIVTDLPPLVATDAEDARPELWYQVGAPAPNAAITSARLDGAGLGLTGTTLSITISDPSGTATLNVTGPDGPLRASLEQDLRDPALRRAAIETATAGPYLLTLTDATGDAYDGDNRARLVLPEVTSARVDWQLASLPLPAGLAQDTEANALLVASLSGGPPDRVALLTFAGRPAANPSIGFFQEGDPLLETLNLDVFETLDLPVTDLPDGFVPILADTSGAVWLARRLSPPAILVPELRLSGGSDARNTTLVLFFNALRDLVELPQPRLTLTWERPDGTPVPGADLEGASTRPLAPAPDLSQIGSRPAPPEPLPAYPWLIAAALLLLAIERFWSLSWRRAAAEVSA